MIKAAMLSAYLQKQLTSRSHTIFWFSLSLTFAVIYAVMGLQQAFGSEYVVQDDARQHVFWMRRFLNPEIFPGDLIADYFQSVAPWGYTWFYRSLVSLGIEPIFLSKILPLILGIITTGYLFGICLEILPVPATAWIASVLFNQTLWCGDDLSSGTPRSFVYLLLLGFIYYLLRRSLLPCLAAIALQALFYPQCVFLSAGLLLLRLWCWEGGKIGLSKNRSDYLFCSVGLIVAFVVMLPYALKSSEFTPLVSVDVAKTMPEFLPGGRSEFFDDTAWEYWLGGRSGMIPKALITPVTLTLGFLLPILLCLPQKLPLVKQLTKESKLLGQLILTSLALFLAAHALLFRLHLPSRYTQYSLRIVLVIAAALVLTIILDKLLTWASQSRKLPLQILTLSIATTLAIVLVMYPSFLKKFPKARYVKGKEPQIYQFFAQTPTETLIASTSKIADNIPTFSQRSVLVSKQYAIPYHLGYYNQFRQRAMDLVEAQYSTKLEKVTAFIQKYSIDYWLLDTSAFSDDYLRKNWVRQYPKVVETAQANLESDAEPVVEKLQEICTVLRTERSLVLDTTCILNQP